MFVAEKSATTFGDLPDWWGLFAPRNDFYYHIEADI